MGTLATLNARREVMARLGAAEDTIDQLMIAMVNLKHEIVNMRGILQSSRLAVVNITHVPTTPSRIAMIPMTPLSQRNRRVPMTPPLSQRDRSRSPHGH